MITPITEAGGMRPVIQADRDAAAAMWLGAMYAKPEHEWQAGWLIDGTGDYGPVVQAFARHREASTAELVEALRAVLPYTEAEVLAEQSRVRLGAQRNPIAKAVARAKALLAQHEGSKSQ